MPLVPMRAILEATEKYNYAQGAFNVNAVAQAKEFGHSLEREVAYLTIHSMLHLLGYDHLDEGEQKKQMRQREEAIASMIPGMNR